MAGYGHMHTVSTVTPVPSLLNARSFARRAFDEALGHSGSREMYGQSMQQLPVVRAKLGEMALKLDASALLIYRAAWAHDQQSGRTTREASMAKLYATEAAQEIIDKPSSCSEPAECRKVILLKHSIEKFVHCAFTKGLPKFTSKYWGNRQYAFIPDRFNTFSSVRQKNVTNYFMY